MSRAKWTLMQWSAPKFKFGPYVPGLPPPELLSPRQRIPPIDKISRSEVDLQPKRFFQILPSGETDSVSKLVALSDGLDVDTLEEYATALMNYGYHCPSTVLEKLSRYGIQPIDYRIRETAVLDTKGVYSPLEILRKNPHEDPAALQQALDTSRNILGTPILELEEQWCVQLESHRFEYDEDVKIISEVVPWHDQCKIVAEFLGELVARNVHSSFPKSLSGLCSKLGSKLEDRMLQQTAQLNGITLVHPGSTFMWSLLGHAPWTIKQRIRLGAQWLSAALRFCKFRQANGNTVRSAFWKTLYVNKTHRRGVFVANSFLLAQLRGSLGKSDLYITAKNLPLLIEPRPWTTVAPRRGMSLIASPSTEGSATVEESLKSGACCDQLRGLNRLQSQSWRVNTRILEVLKADFKPEIQPDSEPQDSKQLEYSSKAAIAIADALGTRAFYLPMYMDFRGRCYSSAKIFLNFMGEDAIRSLFLFGAPQKLGRSGLNWLYVHIANMTGKCKSQSFAARIDWVNANRANIIGAASDPENCDWWRGADKPYQTLAACMELKNAWEAPGGPAEFSSYLPVQLDGSSNGLQHLVALARDEKNAAAVNLTQGQQCGDIYTEVAADGGMPELDRQSIKKAVMTHFYGASERTISESLSRTEFVDKFNSTMATRFVRERQIQLWLVDCARRIMKSRVASQAFSGAALAWTSPLGLPVVQPYVDTQNYAIRTPLQSFWLASPFHQQPVNCRKQISSVNANFIHSLDAAHMLLTASMMPPEASFSAIHDSFWTHAGTVDTMNEILRAAFVEVHKADRLTELREEWMTRYGMLMTPAKVYSDSPLYQKILWERSGVDGGQRERGHMERELVDHYEKNERVAYQSVSRDAVKWQDSTPYLGTPDHPSVKMWVPLELSKPPPRGEFDLNGVCNAKYFFN